MILLLGSTGYIGNAFQTELTRRGEPFVGLSRSQVDYTRFTPLYEYLKTNKPSFVINAAGYTGKPAAIALNSGFVMSFSTTQPLP